MVKAEKAFKWGIAIVVIFGILNAFYFLHLVTALKVVLPILCVLMIGSILLQSGKGGGLAAIGGLGDQAAFGTRTSTFLTKVTYLIGAAFIVSTIFLFKLSIPSRTIQTIPVHDVSGHTHEHIPHEEKHEAGSTPVHSRTGTESHPEALSGVGMRTVTDGQDNKQSENIETKAKVENLQTGRTGNKPVTNKNQRNHTAGEITDTVKPQERSTQGKGIE